VASPNQAHLQGRGISVSYYPDGFGAPVARTEVDVGPSIKTPCAPCRSTTTTTCGSSLCPIGTIVSITLVMTVDTGSTTFSLLVPDVQLPQDQTSVSIHTGGITTILRVFVALVGHPQSETYTVTRLHGTAAVGALPQ